MKLLTVKEYKKLSWEMQGYATYMQAEWPGSKIPKTNPYNELRQGNAYALWKQGVFKAMLEVMEE